MAAPVAVGVGGDATTGDANAQAGAFSEQDQQASNDEANQSIDQQQNAASGSGCDTDCKSECDTDCSKQQPANDFGDQNAEQNSEQSIEQQQENTQLTAGNVAVAAPVAVGVLGDTETGDATAQAGAFSEQDQQASNEANQGIVQEQEVII